MSTFDALDALLFAALSGPFEPKQALQAFASYTNQDGRDLAKTRLAMAATRLADVCDTHPVGSNDLWLLRTPVRHSRLKLLTSTQLTDAVNTRRDNKLYPTTDPETVDLLAVLLNEPPLRRAKIQKIIKERNDRVQLERVIVALDRAGDVAPAKDLLQPARAALAEFHRVEKIHRVAERGFFGRETECAEIAKWLTRPFKAGPITCLFVTGAPGIGKSTLLAESVRRYYESYHPLILRLDFDRAGLDVQDRLGLTMEAARQLAEQLEAANSKLLDARLEAGRISELKEKRKFTNRQSLPAKLTDELGKAVIAAGRPLLVVLDTLEVLRGRGETHPESLFGWLDSLVAKGVRPMHVLAAGRGDALDTLRHIDNRGSVGKNIDRRPKRVKRLELSGLDENAALAFLVKLEAPPRLQRELLELAQGNPLKLRLAAEIAKRSGLERVLTRKRGREISAAFLYRLLLSRIEDPDLRRLAHPGLIVRRINADVIRNVLAPTLGLGSISQERANDLLHQLATHHWLVERDASAPEYLKHRSDMRTLLLPLLYTSSPKQAARVDAAALRWFAATPHPWAQVEAVYHQLQLTRSGRPIPSVSSQIASMFDADTLDELPPPAADLVRSSRGERTSHFRSPQMGIGSWGDDSDVEREILVVLQRQDWVEGAYVMRSIMDAGGVDVRSRAADAIRTFLWRSGQWAQARRWLAERDRFNYSDEDLSDLPDPLALARLEMRAEFTPERLRRSWRVWRPVIERLVRTTVAATDNGARDGALALLLANLPEPFHFPRSDSRESNLAAAANERWAGSRGREAKLAHELGRLRLRRVAPEAEHARKPLSGRVLATLTPYAAFANNLTIMEGHAKLSEAAGMATIAIARAGGLFDDRHVTLLPPPSSDHVGWLADLGLFAEWAAAIAFVRRDGDLRLIGRAAERWRRTMAGDWSIGRRRGEWQWLPLLDQTLHKRLRDLLKGPDSKGRAREQLAVWSEALGIGELLPLLCKRLPCLQTEQNKFKAERDPPDVITRRLLAHGVPAAFAPAVAVLIIHHELSMEGRAL